MDEFDKTDRLLDPSLLAKDSPEEVTQDMPVSDVTEPSIKVVPAAEPSTAIKAHLNQDLLKKARTIREQRDVLRERIEKIEASKGQVKENVYQKVAADYLQRLEESRKGLLAIKDEIDQELSSLYEKEKGAAGRAHVHEENIEEARFRHELGEYEKKAFQDLIAKEENLFKTVNQEQTALQGAIEQYEQIFTGEDLGEPIPSPAEPPAQPEPAEITKTEVPAEPPSVPSTPPSPSVGAPEPRVANREGGVSPEPQAAPAQAKAPAAGTILLRESGEVTGEFPIESQLMIGRSPTNEVVLREAKVSRKHAGILKKGEGYLLVDNKSSNGTFVNGNRVAEHMLNSGDMIQIGSYELEFKTH